MLEEKDLQAIGALLERQKESIEKSFDKKLEGQDKRFKEILNQNFKTSENLVLQYVDDTRRILEEEIQKVQKNLDELNQYYRITRLENDNGALLMEIIKQMQDKMQKMEEEFEELKKKTA